MFLNSKIFLTFLIFFFCTCYQNFVYCQNVAVAKEPVTQIDDFFKFNNFYKVLVEEKYSNEGHICDRCKISGHPPDDYKIRSIDASERCHGVFDDCTVVSEPLNRGYLVDTLKTALKLNNEDEVVAAAFNLSKFQNIDKNVYNKLIELQNSCGMCSCYCTATRLPDSASLDETLVDSICLDPISVDIAGQYAISGIRFAKSYSTLVLEAQVGKLISPTAIRGSPPPEWKVIERCKHLVKINHKDSIFLLDKVILPGENIMTDVVIRQCDERWTYEGVTIRTIRKCNGNFFYLNAYGTTLDNMVNNITNDFVEAERSGKLSLNERTDLTNNDMVPRIHGKIEKLSDPGKHYVKFRTTSWNKDNAKKIIPHIDLRPSVPDTSKPLVGIELEYFGNDDLNGAPRYGGFISPTSIVYID